MAETGSISGDLRVQVYAQRRIRQGGCSGLCPVKFQLLEKMEAPEHLWEACSGICPYWSSVVLQSDRISCVLVCAHRLSSYHSAPKRRPWLHLPYSLNRAFILMDEILLSLVFSRLNSLSQAFLKCHTLQSFSHKHAIGRAVSYGISTQCHHKF